MGATSTAYLPHCGALPTGDAAASDAIPIGEGPGGTRLVASGNQHDGHDDHGDQHRAQADRGDIEYAGYTHLHVAFGRLITASLGW